MLPFGIALAASALYAGTKILKKHRRRCFLKTKPPEPSARFGALRRQQLQDISSPAHEEVPSETEREANHYLAVSSAAMGFSTVGALVFPPLSLVSAPIVAYTCIPIFQSAYKGLAKERRLTVAIIDSLAVVGALATGYYFISSLASWLYYAGQKILAKTEDASRKSLIDVFVQQPRFVWLLQDGIEVQVPYEALQEGDVLVVKAGETVSVDGEVIHGMATVDQRTLTGEAQPAEKGAGDYVFATTIVLSGHLHIRMDKAGAATVAAQIGAILNRTADFKASIEMRSDRFADRSVLPTLGLGALALSTSGLVSAIAVISCNYSEIIRVIVPLGMLNFLNLASQRGILVKDGRSLEVLHRVDTVIFDKTGTLTMEQPHVGAIHTCHELSEDLLLTYAAAAEARQSHPIARAICQEALDRALPALDIDEATYEIGYGIKVRLEDQHIWVGSARFMELEGIAIPEALRTRQAEGHERGYTFVCVAMNGHLSGMIELHATIRPESRQIVQALQQRQLTLYIVSGDHAQPTSKLAQELGIEHYVAEALPEDKAQFITQLQSTGKSVCFVGDGINDAIALKQADVSVSLRGASTAAVDTAQIILMDQSLHQLDHLFALARHYDTNIKTGLATTLIPGAICAGGIFFLHLGLFSALLLYNVSLAAGVSNAMLPWLSHRKPLLT